MLRQLLTLFPVITGLGLAAQPAVALEADVVSMAQAADSSDCELAGAAPAQLTQRGAARGEADKPCTRVTVIIWTPTVMLRIDRAHE